MLDMFVKYPIAKYTYVVITNRQMKRKGYVKYVYMLLGLRF